MIPGAFGWRAANGPPPSPRPIDEAAARAIRLVGLDVDGVLTDGGIYLGDAAGARVELKRYDIQDGLGIHFLRQAGLVVAIVTGRVSESVRLRAAELGIEDVAQDASARKLAGLLDILHRHRIAPSECAFIGDDFPDLPILRCVGMPVCVDNAVPEVWSAARVRLSLPGGRGAVRQFSEMLLRARGEWESVTERYLAERSVPERELASAARLARAT